LLPRGGLLAGLELHDRLASVINKFFNFNSFPAALALFALCVVSLTDDRVATRWRYPLIASGSAAMALFSPIPVLAFGCYVFSHSLFAALDLAPRLASREAAQGLGRKLRIAEPCWAPALAAAGGVALVAPFLISVAAAYGGEVAIQGDAAALARHCELMGWAFLPVLPVYAVAGFRLGSLPVSLRVHWLTGLLLAAATLFLSIPANDPNEYKFALLSSIPSSLLLLGLATSMDRELLARFPRWPGLRALSVGGLVLGGLAALGSTSLIYLASDWAAEDPYRYAGRQVVLNTEDGGPLRAQREAAYAWLRSETSREAFVLQEPGSKDQLELSVIAQRRVVAALPSMFTRSIPYHPSLVAQSHAVAAELRSCSLGEEDLRGLFELPAPWPGEIYAFVARDPLRRREGCSRPAGVEAVFSNAAFEILRIAAPGAG